MDLGMILLQLLILLALGGLALLGRRYLPSYMAQKGQNLATKEDIAAITARIEEAKQPFAEAAEELRHELERQKQLWTVRQQLYVELAESAAVVFVGGGIASDEDKKRFLAAYTRTFLVAPDPVVAAVGDHLDVQVKSAAEGSAGPVKFQSELKKTLRTLLLALRRDGFEPATELSEEAYRFVSFG